MAEITTITKDKADEILGLSVISGAINPTTGHLILTCQNGSTIDAGDFTTIVEDIFDTTVNAAVATQVYNSVSGTHFAKGDISGAVSFSGITNVTLVNALITARLIGNITIAAADLPASPRAGTQFAFRMAQDGTGSRTLTLTGFKKSQGVLTLTTAPNAHDIVVFMYDGSSWYAGFMGIDFK